MKVLLFLFLIVLDCVRGQFGSNFNLNQQTSENVTLSPTDIFNVFGLPPTVDNKDGGTTIRNNLTPTPIPGTGIETCQCIKKQLCSNTTIGTDGRGQIDIREQNRCNDYLLVCCSPENILPFVPNPIPEGGGGCGIRNPEGVGYRILGGKENEAQFGEYPWMVAILRADEITPEKKLIAYKCGASLIHPKVVLTSAHCVDEPGMEFRIRAGEWDTKTTNEFFDHQDRGVQSIIIHPDFYKRGLFNDVALIVLDQPFELASHIRTVCLPSQDEVLLDQNCTATGWGKKSFDRDSPYQVILKRVNLPIVQRDLCQEQLRKSRVGPFFILDKSLICAGGVRGIDTCAGDGGSPLVCPIRGKRGVYQQRGLVAWGIGCGDEYPAVYGNVADFRNWIDNEMLKLRLDISTYTN